VSRLGSARAWWVAIRPATLGAAIAPVLVGTALAARDGVFRLGPALAALAGGVLIQIGTNLTNDADDFLRGADTAARVGPVRATQSGLLTLRQVRTGAWVAFGAAALLGVYLIVEAGWVIAVLGAAAIAAGLTYTGGPWPLGYHGLGDVCVFAFFGVAAVSGTYYVQAMAITGAAFLLSVAMGALATAILVVNNVRDVETDAAAGTRTLPVRLGARFGRWEYRVLVALAYGVPAVMWQRDGAHPWLLLPLVSLPRAVQLARMVATARNGAPLNTALRGTAQLELLFAALFAIGLVL
jgi:1,4-dihydroxy-2-naphthoate octaprenyltransferase